ncbi:MAG: cadherin-like domain-containing protein [Methylovulum sp.]|nr:cadherin-like domain-containing protein [Methylovulum sp.]
MPYLYKVSSPACSAPAATRDAERVGINVDAYTSDYALLAKHLVNDIGNLTAKLYAVMIKEADDWFTPHNAYGSDWATLQQEIKDALYVTYTNIGKDGMEDLYQTSTAGAAQVDGKPFYEPLPAAGTGGGVNHLVNAFDIGSVIGVDGYGTVSFVSARDAWAQIALQNTETGLAYREALVKLRPFAVEDGSYDNADSQLDLYNSAARTGSMTENYIRDRSDMLSWKMQLRHAGAEPDASNTVYKTDWQGQPVYFEDRTSQLKIFLGSEEGKRILFGSMDGDILQGAAKDDHLYGGRGDDALVGNGGSDHLEGGVGNDTYIFYQNDGIDTILDHSGNDQIQISGAIVSGEFIPAFDVGHVYYSADKTYELRQMEGETWRLSVLNADTEQYQAVVDLDHWQSGEFNITKSTGKTQERIYLDLTGSPAFLNFSGVTADKGVHFVGNDKSASFSGSNNSDIIVTGGVVAPLSSNKLVDASTGDDYVKGGDGREYIRTGPNGASTTVTDNDIAFGGQNTDILLGGFGSDQLWGDADNGIWLVEDADSGERGDWLNGENGNDSLYGSRSKDVMFGGAGEDLVMGGAGDDLILGDARYASFSKATGLGPFSTLTKSYVWSTTKGIMELMDNAGSYALNPVRVVPSTTFTWVATITGDDFTLTTPAGFIVEKRLDVDGGNDVLYGGLGNDWLAGQTGDDYLEGGDGNDILYGDDVDGLMTAADQGDDVLLGGDKADRLFGGAGDDILGGGQGNDTVYGGAGQDIIFFNQGDGRDTVYDPDQDTTLIFGAGITQNDIELHLGSLVLDLGNGDEIHIEGFDPNDVFNSAGIGVFGFADGTALTLASLLARGFDLNGAATDDSLTGTNTADRIQGLAGNDTLEGGAGADVLDGGAGSDTFIFSLGDGQDEITDGRQASTDIEAIEFSNVAATDASFNRPAGTDDLLLAYGIDDQVIVNGFFGANTTDGMAHFFFSDGVALTRYADIVALLPTVGNTAPALTGVPVLLADDTEDTARIIAATDLLQGYTDANGDTLSVDSLTTDNGTLADNLDGTWTFIPSANYHGTVVLSYNVIDGNGGSVAASQSFSVTAVNDAPAGVATAVLVSGAEDAAYTVYAADLLQGLSDVDGDTLSVSGLSTDSGSLIDHNDGTWTFTPAVDFNGSVALSYDVVDGNGGSVAASQGFSVTAVNDGPVGAAAAVLVSGVEDIGYVINAADLLQGFSDVDGDTLSVSGLSADSGSVVDHTDGTWTFTPNANYNGPINLVYSVIDGQGGLLVAGQSFNLAAVNDAPVGSATAVLAVGSEDTAYVINAGELLQGFSDVDGDALSITDLSADNGSLLDNNDGTWTFTPAADFNGAVTLSYDVVDGNGGSVAAGQGFSVTAVNDAPAGVATAVLVSGVEDTGYVINAADLLQGFSDVDGDTLSVSGMSADSGSVVDHNDGTWTFTPAADFNGSVTLSYNVVDGNGGSVAAGQRFSVTAVNDAPVGAVRITGLAVEGQTLFADAGQIQDADGLGIFNYQWLADSRIISGANAGSYHLGAAEVGKAVSVQISYVDGGNTPEHLIGTETAIVLGLLGQSSPVANDDSIVTEEEKAFKVNVLANDTDADNDMLVLSAFDATSSKGGHVVLNVDGTLTYRPKHDFIGADSFTYKITDGQAESNVATVHISVVDDDPIKSSVSMTLPDTALNLVLTGKADINGAGNGWANHIIGNKGNNVLDGKAGNDRLEGQEGKDILIGGTGNDSLKGGDGKDIYLFTNNDIQAGGVDKVFDSKGDAIDLTAMLSDTRVNGAKLASITKSFVLSDTLSKAFGSETNLAFNDGKLLFDIDHDGSFSPNSDFQIVVIPTNQCRWH